MSIVGRVLVQPGDIPLEDEVAYSPAIQQSKPRAGKTPVNVTVKSWAGHRRVSFRYHRHIKPRKIADAAVPPKFNEGTQS
jgi:hypothetical protein